MSQRQIVNWAVTLHYSILHTVERIYNYTYMAAFLITAQYVAAIYNTQTHCF